MTDKQQALRALLDKVVAGEQLSGNTEFWAAAETAFERNAIKTGYMADAFYGSTDAALALHNAVLPEWDWRLEDNVQGYVCHIGPTHEEFMPSIFAVGFESAARTFLTADLKALIAKGQA